MYQVLHPGDMNEVFAEAVNSRRLENLLSLCEPESILIPDESDRILQGENQLAAEWKGLLEIPGTFFSRNNFCVQHNELALLRADWCFVDHDGNVSVEGSSSEIVRRQADGHWLYVIDHAMGVSRPRVRLPPKGALR